MVKGESWIQSWVKACHTHSHQWAGKAQYISITLTAKGKRVTADLVKTAGRQGPVILAGWTGKAQTPLPGRASTGTSRSMGTTQGNLHTRKTTSDSRIQGVHTERPCYHSLNRCRERQLCCTDIRNVNRE